MNARADILRQKLALRDELDRLRAKRNFLAYYQRMTGFHPPKHIKIMAKVVQALEEDIIDRAMVFAPPRHAKTLVFSVLAPSFIIGRHPGSYLMTVAHTQKYGSKIGRAVRNAVSHRHYPFEDVELAADSQARDQWATNHDGEYNSFGIIGGNQHGNPAEWLFMDDIVKGRKIALSAHMRDEIWETYKADLLSRLQGRRKQLMVFTRWHMDDPAGRILPEGFDGRTGWYRDRETGEKWYVLCMPAVAEHDNDPCGREPGEWLWEEAFGEEQLGGMRRRGGWIWSSLYQQRPSPEEGLVFQKEHFGYYDRSQLDMTSLEIYGSSDYAISEEDEVGSTDPDYTVHMVWGVDPRWNVYLLDAWRGRTDSHEWVVEWVRLVKRWKPLRWFEEQGQIMGGVGPFLARMAQDANVYTDRVQIVSDRNKVQRAQSLLAWMGLGRVFFPKKDRLPAYMLTFMEVFEKELLQFPTAKHDDTVDPATLFARGLNRIVEGRSPKRGRRKSAYGEEMDAMQSLDDLFREAEEEERRIRRERG